MGELVELSNLEEAWDVDEAGLLLPHHLPSSYVELLNPMEATIRQRRAAIQRAYQRLRAVHELPVVPVHLAAYPDALQHLSFPLLVEAFSLSEQRYRE